MIQLVAFLGNYGREYEKTRHNTAWQFADSLPFYSRLNFSTKFQGQIASLDYSDFVNLASNAYPELSKNGEGPNIPKNAPSKIFFLKPETYMNLSGQSIGEVCNFYKIKPEEVLVVHDELEMNPGFFSLKFSGGLAGHNGLRSTKAVLNTPDFFRLRFGIGKPANVNIADYVLSNFSKDEAITMSLVYEKAGLCLAKTLLASDPSRLTQQWGKVNVNA
ncbi:MAG: aminoacyl-tRNA hydrolase [Treponema sp.]|uniref:aminoacyl-tRNA hydrolase n=1 Tax=Treponema sp. TaxID=166 RepID=UPI00298E2D59|nr:aminoacyl-tRNA hydrolase [Treponema sp.]MCI5696600.1 aminoacyl-tRNA hydrolase [Spirochaetia bacterium]MDD5810998.1 aminoacyl-tRNA hydrolase [Treponema sp.]MDY5884772.1 aminoacyl-tRNA hydrolase [Treponema sp.]